jgi:hypothetical protein
LPPIRLTQVQIVSKRLKHVRAALNDIICQELNPVSAHHRQYSVMALLKVGLAELDLHGGQFAPQDGNKKVPASARGLQEPRINTLGLALHQVEHVFD